jgi:multidrug efflux pump subunit AcrA (membrane-fusion protein)
MKRHLIPPLVAAVLLLFAVAHALYVQRPEPEIPPPVPPPTVPFGHTVAGAGMVEPATEASGTATIAVGSQVAGVIARVAVRIGQEVKAGDPLFDLGRRQVEAELAARKAVLAAAQAQVRKLELQPRPEEVPVSEAQVSAAEANCRQQQDQRERDRKLAGTAALAEQDRVAHEQAFQAARAQLELAKANLALLKAGAWEADKAIAAAGVEQARAQVEQARTQLDLLLVQAPVDGTILQVNVRLGEYVPTAAGQSLILMGNLHPLHVRVNVDEEDLPRLRLNAPAQAKVRGDARQDGVPLRFVRLEPYVVPKTSLTGANTERVDTRVFQIIYALDPRHPLVQAKKILVGQLVDVFIDTRPAAGSEESSGRETP